MKQLLLSALALVSMSTLLQSCDKSGCHIGIEREPEIGRISLFGKGSYWIYEDQFGNKDTVTVAYTQTETQDPYTAGDEYTNDEYNMDMASTYAVTTAPDDYWRLDRKLYSSDHGRSQEVCIGTEKVYALNSDYPDFFLSPYDISVANRLEVTVNGTVYSDAYVHTESPISSGDSTDYEIKPLQVVLVDGIGIVRWESQNGRIWNLIEHSIQPY